MSAAIETQGLSRRFGQRRAVDDLSMTVPERAVYGFLGRNGAGKTTTLKMILGLIRPSVGTARVNGIDVSRDRIGAARQVGALLEAHGFYGNLTGRENLGLTATLIGLRNSEIDRVLDVVEMRADADRKVGGYSLGMRQRLGLARAMLGAPPILVLDEPTNGLDPDGIADMRRFLRSLPERTGATVLLSSHLLGEIEQTATHVGVVNDGRLVLEGELSRLKADLAPEILLRTGDDARAVQALLAGGYSPVAFEGGLSVALRPGQDLDQAAAELVRVLVAGGAPVFAVGPKPRSLEDIYRGVAMSRSSQAEAA
ncbi:ABC transporter ATP-binding protein [Caulobacter vibrioides]|uniref:ABC transporter, ATP-binding protein n=2 Tax=Caulobacter vibrioides TaxID=155892 RepID=Q9A3C4_CAUVC|nr:ABC transporter ATP-binding protein [Caulobacter vibrioides]YP_002518762.1 ABC transporter ATP-binding cassette domain protein [Caulobacter vibrioides NA1000]AAK25242.1 ABC transporter, ATP-binding protein [Caulobacter vibrioides CB15]ACL96854.1 ABC transporter ATP-binding cassette domain protein [Caulobacter vibrioides NA1000]ATC30107.1 ABC transporter ATP-binding protein [Caulobacter vibrioides]QXZ51632.1 ABC transporter ATP-binding protein [Caulobacter vibrioides]